MAVLRCLLTLPSDTYRTAIIGLPVTVQHGSGRVVQLALRLVRHSLVIVGLTTSEVRLDTYLGNAAAGGRACGWSGYCGWLDSTLAGIDEVGDYSVPKYRTGDEVGVVVDCRARACVRFFVNRVQVLERSLDACVGTTLHPAFSLYGGGHVELVERPSLL